MTTIVTTTAIPRQGAGGIGRSNSRGGPPWICSSREGLRKNKRGSRTRLLKIEPGAFSTEPFVHDHWEEVYVVQGDLVVGNDRQGKGGQQCFAPTYACRPPGVHHGPFTSRGGCILHEIHYYAQDRK